VCVSCRNAPQRTATRGTLRYVAACCGALQCAELRPTNVCDRLASLGHPSKFQQVSRFGFVIFFLRFDDFDQQHSTEGATCIRLGGHDVGHRPIF